MNLTLKFILVAVLSAGAGAGVMTIHFESKEQADAARIAQLLESEKAQQEEFNQRLQKTLKNSKSFPGGMANTFKNRY